MRPLDPLAPSDDVPAAVSRLLREAKPDAVEAELARLEGEALVGLAAAARRFARGALALRVGRLADAEVDLEAAADAFAAAGEGEAEALCRCEAWLTRIRRGPRAVYDEAAEALSQLAEHEARRVRVVARHYQGTALRFAGQAETTLEVLLRAFRESDGLLVERAQTLNSLGTLYVVLGAFGAAEAVLAHAAELNHQIGDRVSEAISYGQLGSAALFRGELEQARRYLQKQEWFASQVGDAFGRARALVILADLAIDLGRPDDARDLATQGREVAESVEPPLAMWVAYACRTVGRAQLELGEETRAKRLLDEAESRFRQLGNQLGEAMVQWDRGRHDSAVDLFDPAWAFANLGLSARVAQVLADASRLDPERIGHATVAAAGQLYPHLATRQEVDLVLSQPEVVAAIATRRIAGQRNLGRLGALTLASRGLFIAAIAASAIGTGIRPLPSRRCGAALVGQVAGAALWVWSGDTDAKLVARDLSALRVTLGEDTRVVIGHFPDGRVASVPFAGEFGAELHGADLGPLLAEALSAPPGAFRRHVDAPWDKEAEALARMSGFKT